MVGGEVRPVTRRREQAVLARLALVASRPVPVDVLVADVWGDDPPATAIDALRVHVSNLRKLLDGGERAAGEVLQTATAGYRLDLPPTAVDTGRFEAAVRRGDVEAIRHLVASWPDPDLGQLDSGSGFFEAAARDVAERREVAVGLVAEAELTAGHPDRAVPLLEAALHRAPYREHLWELLVTALDAMDRRAEPMRAFQRAREALADVGMPPGPGLRGAEAAVLARASAPASTRPVPEYVEVDGSRVAYATFGSGPLDLLFVHGGFVPLDTMRDAPRLARFLDELAGRFRVLLVDRRGIGMSDPPADGSPVTVEHWADDLAAVLDVVGSRRALVFAHENAGPPAILLAARRPGRVAGLLLHSTAARPLRAADHPYGGTEESFRRIDAMIDRQPGSADIMRWVAPSAGEDQGLRSWLDRAGRLGAGPARAREMHRTYLYADVRHALPHVRTPALVLQPARLVRSDPGQARYLAEQLPDADLEMLDSADHLPWLADADAVLAALDRLRYRAKAAEPAPPPRLRALVAVVPGSQSVAELLTTHGATSCTEAAGAVVGAFDSMAEARLAADDIGRTHANAALVVDSGDPTGAADDREVERVAAAAGRSRSASPNQVPQSSASADDAVEETVIVAPDRTAAASAKSAGSSGEGARLGRSTPPAWLVVSRMPTRALGTTARDVPPDSPARRPCQRRDHLPGSRLEHRRR